MQEAEIQDLIRQKSTTIQEILKECEKVVVGQRPMMEKILLAFLCDGHILLEGLPGLAKTLAVKTFSSVLDLSFNRIQFTPDLMPSDITGTEILQENKTTGQRELRFVQGPVFANLVLADEINRAPAKVQSALLEGMQERQVTIGGQTHPLPRPFFEIFVYAPRVEGAPRPLTRKRCPVCVPGGILSRTGPSRASNSTRAPSAASCTATGSVMTRSSLFPSSAAKLCLCAENVVNSMIVSSSLIINLSDSIRDFRLAQPIFLTDLVVLIPNEVDRLKPEEIDWPLI